jgi:hypothetical protein
MRRKNNNSFRINIVVDGGVRVPLDVAVVVDHIILRD